MQGRIYDPKLGRFAQADPFVSNARDTQAYNRYAYVNNAPLHHTDPTGYCLDGMGCGYYYTYYDNLPNTNVIGTVPPSSAGSIYQPSDFPSNGGSLNTAGDTGGGGGDGGEAQKPEQKPEKKIEEVTVTAASESSLIKPFDIFFVENAENEVTVVGNYFGGVMDLSKTKNTGLKFAGVSEEKLFYEINGTVEVEGDDDISKRTRRLSDEFRGSLNKAYLLGVTHNILAAAIYIFLESNRGPWNYKRRPEYKDIPGVEDFGNFAFGATASAFMDGFTSHLSAFFPDLTTNFLMRGAGFYQEYFQRYDPSDGHWYDLSSPATSNYGDQFSDQMNIYYGAEFFYEN